MRVEIALVTGGGLQKNELFAGERPRGVYGQIGPVYPPNGGQKDDPEAFYGSHTPTGAIPTENEPRPATSSRLLYPQSTLRSVKALRDKEDYPLRLLKSRCDPGISAQRSLLVGKVRKVPSVQMLFSAGFLRFGRQ